MRSNFSVGYFESFETTSGMWRAALRFQRAKRERMWNSAAFRDEIDEQVYNTAWCVCLQNMPLVLAISITQNTMQHWTKHRLSTRIACAIHPSIHAPYFMPECSLIWWSQFFYMTSSSLMPKNVMFMAHVPCIVEHLPPSGEGHPAAQPARATARQALRPVRGGDGRRLRPGPHHRLPRIQHHHRRPGEQE